VLIPLGSTADTSNTPASKSVVVRFELTSKLTQTGQQDTP